MITLDKRLALLAQEMTPGGFGVDVGTDHGYLAVYLIESGRASRMTATDINPQPLQSAQNCIQEHGLADRIETRLTNGLEGLDLMPVTDILIAGMGGILMTEILAARHPLSGKKLILQPMTQAPALREWLMKNGYFITGERCAVSAGKPYTVITAQYDGEARAVSRLFALIGRTPEDRSADADAYLHKQLNRLERKAAGLQKAAGEEGELAETTALIHALREQLEQRKNRPEADS